MATITADEYLDSGTARTANETWTMNGGVLTVRTDTRCHVGAPANMTGSLGSSTVSSTLGGGVFFDARDVRWLPVYNTSGNAPNIGTTISSGGVSGYFLGFWSSLTAAPIFGGTPLPVGLGDEITGYIKFREVTGGTFAADNVLSGISATAKSPDVLGWIEIVNVATSAYTIPRLGFLKSRGGWFELGETTGSAGQIIQTPTNNGGNNTFCPAIWIETAPSSGVYESYPAMLSTWFNTGNLGTDQRSKFVEMMTNGQVRIGSDGTDNIGYVPPAGCKIRIPNIILRQCASGSPATNAAPNATIGSRPKPVTTSSGFVDLEHTIGDWYINCASPFKLIYKDSATTDAILTSNIATPSTFDNIAVGHHLGTLLPFNLTTSLAGGEIKNCNFPRANSASSGHAFQIATSSGWAVSNVKAGIIALGAATTGARSTGRPVSLSECSNLTLDNIQLTQGRIVIVTGKNLVIRNTDYCDRYGVDTNANSPDFVIFTQTSSDNILVDGITFGLNGLINNCNPYGGVCYAINSSNITFRNVGTYSNPLQSNQTFAPQNLFQDGGGNDGILVQRMYCNSRTTPILTVNSSQNITLESLHGTTGAVQILAGNTTVKGCRSASNSTTGGASVYGSHFFDIFTSDTQGRIWVAFNEPTEESSQFVQTTFGTGAGFTAAGSVSMPNVNDEIIFEWPHYIIGHTGFVNTANVVTGTNTGNFSYEFAIDKNDGNGFSSYSACTGENLNAVTGINAAKGFKMRFRIKTVTANANNALTYFRVTTTTTSTAQQNNLYPLDVANIKIDGLVSGSRIQIYDMDNEEELYNDVVSWDTLFFSVPWFEDVLVRVRINYQSGITRKKHIEFFRTLKSSGFEETVNQIPDNIYEDNAIDGSLLTDIEFDDAEELIKFSNSEDSEILTFTWQQIYAYEGYWLQTEEGIRDKGKSIEAVDHVNYRIKDFKLKNMSAVPLIITGGYGVSATTGQSLDLIDVSGGTIFSAPDHVVGFTTGSSGGSGGAGDSKEDIYTYFTSSGRQNTFRATVPSAGDIATEVWATTVRTITGGTVTTNNDKTGYSLSSTGMNGVTLPANIITASSIASNAITDAKIASNAIQAAKIQDGALTAAKFAASSLNGKGDWATTAEIKPDLTVINDGVKKASLLIPHNTNLPS